MFLDVFFLVRDAARCNDWLVQYLKANLAAKVVRDVAFLQISIEK